MGMNDNQYDDSSIRSLKGAERIRARPAAVLGSAGVEGAYHTVTEIIGNSMDEVRAGYGTKVSITRHADGSITVSDTGRGVPMGWNDAEERYNWDLIFNELYAGGKYDDDNPNYEFSLGLNGLGAASTQYSSEFFTVISKREDGIYTKRFEKGHPLDYEAAEYEPNTTGETGTIVHWKPDIEVFNSVDITAQMLKAPLESQAHLNKIVVTFTDEGTGEHIEWEGKGITEFLREKLGDKIIDVLERTADKAGEENGKKYRAKMDLVIAITEETTSRYMHHHNTGVMRTGYHFQAFNEAVTNFFKKVGRENDVQIIPADYDGYLSCVTSTYANVNATSFKNQTKDGVDNKFIYDLVYHNVFDTLEEAQAMHKPSITGLIENVVNAAVARKLAKEFEQKQRLVQKASGKKREKAEKYVDCAEKDPNKRELFIVEGDSAREACKNARDSHFQALLPVKGKPMNGLKAALEDLLKNEEVKAIFTTLGCGFDVDGINTFDESKLEFSKIIITTDADVDGHQIRVLLYTIFYRLAPVLLEKGYIYLAETPLFTLELANGDDLFAYSVEEKDTLVEECRNNGVRIKSISRSKGLGENNADMLWHTTMDPENRRLIQLTIDIKEQIVRDITNMLFGEDVGNERKAFVFEVLSAGLQEDLGLEELVDTITAIDSDREEAEELEAV